MARKSTNYIVIHCSQTKPSMDIGAKEIDRWHRERGWLKIGYHKVIRRNGNIENGRGIDLHDVRGTAWAAYNAVTEFVDHYRPVGRGTATAEQKTDDVVDKRLNSAWFGTGSDIKQTAWDTLLTVATN